MNQVEIINKKKKRKGFTLIELIIVLAVMAIIAAIAIPNFAAVRDSSKKKADTQSCETIKRISLTLIAQGDMKDGVYTITAGSGNPTVTVDPNTIVITDEIKNAFKDVKEPQSHTDKTFEITVDKGDVTSVKTGTIEVK